MREWGAISLTFLTQGFALLHQRVKKVRLIAFLGWFGLYKGRYGDQYYFKLAISASVEIKTSIGLSAWVMGRPITK